MTTAGEVQARARRLVATLPARLEVRWLTARAGARTLEEEIAGQRLKDTILSLPPIASVDTPSALEWAEFRRTMRSSVCQFDARFFLHWPVVRWTMVVRSGARYIRTSELPPVKRHDWLHQLDEDSVGSPRLIPGTRTSGNLVHHAYHLLRFEELTGSAPRNFDELVELGAGYGSMCRLFGRLSSGRVKSYLVDFPEFSALQQYFLELTGHRAHFINDPSELPSKSATSRRLLVATWSLSEMPLIDREAMLAAVGACDGYLFAFNDRFGEVDNLKYFADLRAQFSEVGWVKEEIAHLPHAHYLFGVRA